ncbi:MAG: hypothetical protein KC912_26075 [Proteobacteria bacterium]|nr:hypothetical protein [Pseudomonadota bacterium]
MPFMRVLAFVFLTLGCSTETTDTGPETCTVAEEGCACTGGGSCNDGLTCDGDICVEVPCPVGSEGCECTSGGVCDGTLECESDTCVEPTPDPECGNGVPETGETCDDNNQVTETCDYGLTSCTVCNSNCQEQAGAVSYCGDGVEQSTYEACDVPSDNGHCDYGDVSCQVCTSSCALEAGIPHVCGDDVIDPQEDCDGEALCDACDFIGHAYEPNDSASNAIEKQPSNTDGTFSHPLDVVHGPGYRSSPSLWESPDTFVLDDVCNGGTFTARIEFDRTQGTLDLLIGRRPQEGGSSGPPPIIYEWISDSINDDFQEISIPAPTVGQLARDHYIKVRAHESSTSYIINSYTLTGSVTNCPVR